MFFVLLWYGLQVISALSSSQPNQAITCYDSGHLRREVEGKLQQRDIDYALIWGIVDRQASKPKRHIYFALHRELLGLALKLYWSDKQRLRHYRTFTAKMQPCTSALRQLKRQGRLTPEILRFAERRFQEHGFPVPSADEPLSPKMTTNAKLPGQ